MELNRPRKPMTKFKKIDYGRYLKLVNEAEQGKNVRQRLRDVHHGEILRQCTLRGTVSAYSALQALRFMAFDEYRKKHQVVSVVRENPYAGTPFDFPDLDQPIVTRKSEPTPEEIRLITRELAAKYVLIPEVDWEAMLEISLVDVEGYHRAQLRRKGKQAKKDKRSKLDEKAVQQLLDEAWEEYRQPSLMIQPHVENPCGCIPFAFADPPKPLLDRPFRKPKAIRKPRITRQSASKNQGSLF